VGQGCHGATGDSRAGEGHGAEEEVEPAEPGARG
jgi:hypothetical protein